MKENILPGSPSPPRTQESRVSIRESNASSCWGFLGCQCHSAEPQHCVQFTPPEVSWETAPQRGELFHLVLFKPQKAIVSPRIQSVINTRSYESLKLNSYNTDQCMTLLCLLSHHLHCALQAAINPIYSPPSCTWMKPCPWEGTDGTEIKDFSQAGVIHHKQPACSTQSTAESISHTSHHSITDLVEVPLHSPHLFYIKQLLHTSTKSRHIRIKSCHFYDQEIATAIPWKKNQTRSSLCTV